MFRLEAFEAEALLGARLLAEHLEDPLDVGDVTARLLEVRLERFAELRVLNLGDELRQRLTGELALDVEDVP